MLSFINFEVNPLPQRYFPDKTGTAFSSGRTLKNALKHRENVLALKDEMVDQQIGNKQIDDDIKNSIISLSFYESNTVRKEVIANDDPSAYDLSFFKRLTLTVANGWALFENLLAVIANMWAVIPAIAGLWLCARIIMKKRSTVLVKIKS